MKVEFGIQVEPQFGYSFADVVGIAKTGLKNNFSTLWFSDHFMLDVDAIDKELLEPWLLMTALTQVVPDIRVGSMVFSQSYRNPALSAKMLQPLMFCQMDGLSFVLVQGGSKLNITPMDIRFLMQKLALIN